MTAADGYTSLRRRPLSATLCFVSDSIKLGLANARFGSQPHLVQAFAEGVVKCKPDGLARGRETFQGVEEIARPGHVSRYRLWLLTLLHFAMSLAIRTGHE
ncbi:hypothetical protein CGRA01v4_10372 [Colletotrichum graminicola]|nr:hypothetical protein CGRA01v4_10372 [Colletotrichum graminicola]